MPQSDVTKLPHERALHVEWTFPFADSVSVSTLHSRLIAGQNSRLFDIRLWDCRDGQVSAILALEAPYEEIVAHLSSTGHKPTSLWLENASEAGPGTNTGNIGQPT
jgi:hypothetical protein